MREALSCKIFEPSISRPAYREFLRYLYTGRCGPTADVVDGMFSRAICICHVCAALTLPGLSSRGEYLHSFRECLHVRQEPVHRLCPL